MTKSSSTVFRSFSCSPAWWSPIPNARVNRRFLSGADFPSRKGRGRTTKEGEEKRGRREEKRKRERRKEGREEEGGVGRKKGEV